MEATMFPGDFFRISNFRTGPEFLNQAHGKDTFFDIKRGSDKITYQRVQAGGYRTKKQAESLKTLTRDKILEGSFIVAVKR